MIRVALLHGPPSSVRPEAADDPCRLLHPRELAVLSPKAVPKRRDDFIRGRTVARRLLAEVAPVDPARVALVPDGEGVPWAEDDRHGRLPFSISISHTEGVASAALVHLPWRVGIDVEHPIPRPDGLVGDYFEPCEAGLCESVEAGERPFRAAEVWALKEAAMKALGTGLRIPTSAVVVRAIAAAYNDAGWRGVDLVLGIGAPDPQRTLRAWIRREAGVVVAVSLLVAPAGGPEPRPEAPRPMGVASRRA